MTNRPLYKYIFNSPQQEHVLQQQMRQNVTCFKTCRHLDETGKFVFSSRAGYYQPQYHLRFAILDFFYLGFEIKNSRS